MKKLFLFLFASLLSVSLFAENDGSTKAKAVRYDWSTGIYVSSEANVGKWYVVPLLKEDGGVFNPNGTEKAGKTDEGKTDINITIKNPLNTEVDINCTAYIGDNETNRHFKMAASGSKSMTFGAGMFVRMGINEVYLYLVTDVTVTPEEAAVKEAVNVDVQPVEANSISFEWSEFNWTNFPAKTEATVIPANKETWVKLDFANHGVQDGKTYKFYVEKANATPITVNAGVSYDCPASSIQEQSQELKSASTAKVLDEAKLSMIPGTVYIRIKAPQELRIYAEQVEIPAPQGDPIFNIANATEVLLWDNDHQDRVYTLDAAHLVYSVDFATLQAADENHYRQIEVTNNGSEEVTIVGKASKTPNGNGDVYSVATKTVTIPAGQTYYKKIDKTMQSVVGSAAGDKIWALGPEFPNVTFKLTEQPIDPEYCKDATNFVWNVWNAQEGGTYKWYAVDITTAKTDKADIILTMETANQNEEAEITVDIAAACALGEPTQNYTGKSKSTTKTLSYSLYKDNSNNEMYVRVRTDKNIKVMAELLTTVIYNPEEYGTDHDGWSADPVIEKAARVEKNLTIANGEAIKALGVTLANENVGITIENGGKLIVGKEGIKGSQKVDQIIIKEGGNLMIDPAATTNNKPFIKAYKDLDLATETNPDAVHAGSYKHEFIALPVENRENTPVGLYYSNWTYNVGWGAVDGFRHAFVGYDVTKSTAADYCGYFAGQLAPNQNQTLALPGPGWHAFGNSWLVPLDVLDMISGNKLGAADEAIYLYAHNPITIGLVDYSINKDQESKQYIPVTEEIINEVPALAQVQPMEGFFLYTESATTAKLNYNPLYEAYKAPATKRAEDNRNKVAAVLRGGNVSDFVYMIEGEGAIAHKMASNGLAIYAEDGLAQVANNNLIGTKLTIQTNNNTEYTLNFTWVKGETLVLLDLENGNTIDMTADNTYTFTAEPNTVSERFQVVGRKSMPTAIENTDAIKGANKVLENGKVVIIKNGVKYNVLGAQL